MIKVTVELVSAIHPSRNRILGIGYLANDGHETGRTSGARGSYDVTLGKRQPKENQIWKKGRVESFPRRARGCWDLLYLALKGIVAERNP